MARFVMLDGGKRYINADTVVQIESVGHGDGTAHSRLLFVGGGSWDLLQSPGLTVAMFSDYSESNEVS